jgi:hypothetical protein
VTSVTLNLAGSLNDTTGDGQADSVIVNGTANPDTVTIAGDAGSLAVRGLAARVNITGAEAANDRLTINVLAGDDVMDSSGLASRAIQLTTDGGDGADVLIGDDVLIGGAGDNIPPSVSCLSPPI